jgi:MFS family permease
LTSQKSLSSSERNKSGFFYGYIVVLAASLIMLVSWGTQYSFGVFFKPVLNEFGWSRAVTSGAYSLNMIINGVFCFISGRLADRFGPRIVITVGACFIGLGYLLMLTVHSEWQYYLYYGILLSIGMGCMAVPLLSNVARWFTKGRGLASGIVVAGIGIGIIIMPQVANKLISTIDWRTSFLIIGIAALILIIAFAQLLRRPPDQNHLSSENAGKTAKPDIQVQGLSSSEAMRTRACWIIFLMSAFLCVSIQTVMVHIVAHATDIGFSATTAATILSAVGLVSVIGKISMGSLGDRIGNRNAMLIVSTLMALAFLWIRFTGELWTLYLFGVIFGFAYAGLSAVQSPLVADYFGLKAHGTILGLAQVGGAIGGALGSFLSGFIFDITGSYEWAFIMCALTGIASLVIALLMKPVYKSDRITIKIKSNMAPKTDV